MDILDRITMLLGNRDQKDLTDYLKLNSVAFSEWKSGKSKSYRKYLIEISEFFNVSIDFLVYGKEKVQISQQPLSPDKIRLLEMYDRLTDMEKGEILGELKQMLRAGSQAAAPEAASEEQPKIHIARSAARSRNNIPPKIEEGDFSDLLNAPDSTDDYHS